MIKSVTIKNIENVPVKWANEVEWLWNNIGKPIEFTDGLNIIVGPNGSGKSTLLKMIAMYMHCEQGGISKITQQSINNLVDHFHFRKKAEEKYFGGVELEHDGQIVYHSGDRIVGIDNGHFDDDFFAQGLLNATDKVSSGQTSIRKLNYILDMIESNDDIQGRSFRNQVNNVWKEKYDLSVKILDNPTLPKGKKTIILDEPDSNLDMENQINMLNILYNLQNKYQIIMTAHSVFSLFLMEKNVIETKEGYFSSIEKQMKFLRDKFI